MKNVFLKNNKGFSWFCNEKVSVKGYFFDSENNYYSESKLISFFEDVYSEKDFINKIKEANGVFTVVIRHSDTIFTASDTTRMFPLFYTFKDKDLLISDDIIFLKNKLNITEINKQSANEFLAASHTLGNRTLLENVFQLQSNEYIIFNKNEIKKQAFFFSYSTIKVNENSYTQQKEQAIEVFENAFNRMIKSLNNRHVALPLSGGYDSRFIATMLKKHNYENVTCFTYGRKNNLEIENSRKTAEKLNYKWVFVEYNSNLFNNYTNTNIFKEYAHFVGKASSMPLLQEYFAVKFLKDNKLIPQDSVFIPGHSGDLLGGSQLVKVVNEDLQISDISILILKKKFFLYKLTKSKKKETQKRIRKSLCNFNKDYKHSFVYSVFEDYDIKEKIAKFIFNSSSVYNFFDYEHRFPFGDTELLKFFKDVPFKYKKMKLLYDDVLKNIYFKPFDLNFETEIQPSLYNLYIQKIKNKIKPLFPNLIKKRLLKKKDRLNSDLSTKLMIKSFKDNNLPYQSKIKSYNSIILQWYLYFLKGLIK